MPQVSPTVHTVNAYDLASQYLTALGWPNTPGNQRALAAWFMSESSRSGAHDVNVVGNNPLNITVPANQPYRLVGSHRIAVYSSPQSGVDAFRRLIGVNAYGYPGIKSSFQSGGGGTAPINAITHSGWVSGNTTTGSYWHTVHGSRSNLLQDVYSGLAGGSSKAIFPPGSQPGGGGGTVTTGSGGVVSNFDPILASSTTPLTAPTFLSDPAHILTDQDKKDLTDWIVANADPGMTQKDLAGLRFYMEHYFFPGPSQMGTGFQGKTVGDLQKDNPLIWGKITKKQLGAPTDPITGAGQLVADAISNVGKGAGTLLGGTLVPVATIIGGGAAILFGLYLITKEATATGGSPEGLVSPVPVFIRERA